MQPEGNLRGSMYFGFQTKLVIPRRIKGSKVINSAWNISVDLLLANQNTFG